jgi:hypothetical protein
MRLQRGARIACAVLLLCLIGSASAASGAGGCYKVHCNVDRAFVSFDDRGVGYIDGRVLQVDVFSYMAPNDNFTVEKEGYIPYTGLLPPLTGTGGCIDVHATLEPDLGSGRWGWICVRSTVDNARVFFDDEYVGMIRDGELCVLVDAGNFSYTTFSVRREGYETYSAEMPDPPPVNGSIRVEAEPVTARAAVPLSPLCTAGAFLVILAARRYRQ